MKDKEVIKNAFKDAIVEIIEEFTDRLMDIADKWFWWFWKWSWRILLAALALIGLLIVATCFMQPTP